MTLKRPTPYFLPLLAIGAGSLVTMGLLSSVLRAVPAATTTTAQPAKLPTTTLEAPQGKEIATLAAGCFWSMEAIYENAQGCRIGRAGVRGRSRR
jgi:hypothetical protein